MLIIRRSILGFFLILWAGLLFSNPCLAASYAEEDFKDYKKSSFSKAQCDDFVKEGFVAFDRQDTTSTIELLRKAITLGCKSPLIYFKMAVSYEDLGSYYSAVQYYDLAKEAFKASNKSHRYNKTFHENYGRALLMMGNSEKAWPLLEKAARTTENSWLLKMFAEKALEEDNYLTAVAYYERLLRLQNSDLTPVDRININLKLARIFRNQDQPDAAKRYYEQIIAMDPENPEANKFLKKEEKLAPADPSKDYEKALETFRKSY